MVTVYTKFENLTEDKKRRIIDTCIEEFAAHGYKNASTNNIVRQAEISKGLLFHYFGSKKGLYLYVLDYVIQYLMELTVARMTDLPGDFFDRTMKIGLIKLQTAYEYPLEYRFVVNAFAHPPEQLKEETQARYNKMYTEGLPILFKDIDTSNFRPGIDPAKAIEVITFALEGVSNKYIKSLQNRPVDEIMAEMESINQEYFEYVEILKNGIVGQGSNNGG